MNPAVGRRERRGVPFVRDLSRRFLLPLLPDLRGLPQQFWVLLAATLLDRVGGFIVPYLSIYLTVQRGFSVTQAGVVLSGLALGGLLGGPAGGVAADRFGRKPIIVGGWLAMAAAMAHLGVARSFEHILLAGVVLSACSAFVRPAMNAAIADVVPEVDRRRAYGLQYWALNLGFAFAATLAGALVKVGYTLVFTLDACTSVVTALVLAFAFKESRPARAVAGAARVERLDRAVLRDRAFLAVFFTSLCVALCFQQGNVSLAAEMARDGLVTSYGPLIALNGVCIVLFQPGVAAFTARFRARPVLATGALLTGLGFFLTLFADRSWQHAVPIVVWTFGEMFLAATTPTVIAQLAPEHRRATYQGLHQLSWSLTAFGPALGAWVLDTQGSAVLWGACLVAGVLAASVQLWLRDPRLK